MPEGRHVLACASFKLLIYVVFRYESTLIEASIEFILKTLSDMLPNAPKGQKAKKVFGAPHMLPNNSARKYALLEYFAGQMVYICILLVFFILSKE